MFISRQNRDRALPFVGLGIGVAIWWLAAAFFWKDNPLLQSFAPRDTFDALVRLVGTGEIWPHLWASLRRVLISLGLATLVGAPLGVLLGLWKSAERSTSAIFQFVRMISPISWMPIAVMALGVGDLPVLFLLSMAAVWPVMLNTATGVAAVDRNMILLAQSLSATRWEIIFRVIVPSILSYVLTGLRLAVGVAWIVLVPAEMLGVHAGLGYYVLDTRDRLAYAELAAVILLIGLVGYALDTLLRAVHHAWTHQP